MHTRDPTREQPTHHAPSEILLNLPQPSVCSCRTPPADWRSCGRCKDAGGRRPGSDNRSGLPHQEGGYRQSVSSRLIQLSLVKTRLSTKVLRKVQVMAFSSLTDLPGGLSTIDRRPFTNAQTGIRL